MTNLHTQEAEKAGGLGGQNFQTKDIGKWKAQQESPFAEQNRRSSEHKQAQKDKHRRLMPYVVLVICVAVVGLVTWGLIVLILTSAGGRDSADEPVIADNSLGAALDYSKVLQDNYDQQSGNAEQKLTVVNQMVNDAVQLDSGVTNSLRLAQATFYFKNGFYADSLEILEQLDLEKLTTEQQWGYWNLMYYIYAALGDTEEADAAGIKSYELRKELGGAGGDE